ncbi:MAG: hypothetical protein ACFFD4_11265 [Candidatus Odinarchaeota archaeon]
MARKNGNVTLPSNWYTGSLLEDRRIFTNSNDYGILVISINDKNLSTNLISLL